MKKHLLLLLLSAALLGSIRSTAQPYQSIFGKDSTMWCVSRWVDGNPMIFKVSTYMSLTDTILNGTQYQLVVGDSLSYGYAYISKSFAIREDLDSGLVWLRTLDSNHEYLIMNLGLNVGDTMRPYSNPIYQNLYFTVDSVFWDGQNRKHIRFNNYLFLPYPFLLKYEYIEGIGNNLGFDAFIFQINDFGITCQFKDGQKNWHNPYLNNNDCTDGIFIPTNINDPYSSKTQVMVVPNPSYGGKVAKIVGVNEKEISEVRAYNVHGILMGLSKESSILSVDNLLPGLYLLKVTLINGKQINLKFYKL